MQGEYKYDILTILTYESWKLPVTIKKRLAVSNVLMILVPVCISVITAAVSLLIVYTVLTHGTGIHLSDAEDFPE
ncbi:MAG: hypothetical protein LKF96_06460, partial [Treponema sp.]|nr:hypothetical protein [Treponema sp.]